MARWNDCEVEREMRSYLDDCEPMDHWDDYPEEYYNEFPKEVEEVGKLMEVVEKAGEPPF